MGAHTWYGILIGLLVDEWPVYGGSGEKTQPTSDMCGTGMCEGRDTPDRVDRGTLTIEERRNAAKIADHHRSK